MKKKVVKRSSTSKSKKSSSGSVVYLRYLSFALGAVALILVGKGLVSAMSKVHVLGTSTGPVFFARGGDDSGGGSSGGGDDHGGGAKADSSNSGNGSSSRGGSNSSNAGNSTPQTSVSNNTQVDCIGPDGKHFTTSFKGCSELNNIWHNSNFNFTPLNKSSVTSQTSSHQEKEAKNEPQGSNNQVNKSEGEFGKSGQQLEVKTENGKAELNLKQQGTEVKITTEGNKLVLKAKKADGTEVELKKREALEKVNESLKGKEIELGENENNDITIKKGEVEAETKLPVGVDPITHELTVTTSTGTKTVVILPDEAIKKVLDNKLFTSIESKVSSTNGATAQKTTLTELNNEPVFEVKGVSQKRVLGFVPVGFAKTAFVSATTGKVVRTDETFLNKVLETFSF